MFRIFVAGVFLATASSVSAYDASRVDDLKTTLSFAAICIEHFDDRETFERVFHELSKANDGNPDPNSWSALKGFRGRVQVNAREADLSEHNEDELRSICAEISKAPGTW